MVGYTARVIGKQLKKGEPLLFLEGHDRNLRMIPMEAGITGYWHHKHAELIPDESGTYNFYGSPAGFAASTTVSNVNPMFLRYVKAWRKAQLGGKLGGMKDVLGRDIGTSPEELARAIYDLEKEKREVEERIKLAEQINADQTTIEESIIKLGLGEHEADLFRTEMTTILTEKDKSGKQDVARSLKDRLAKINEARKITVEDRGNISLVTEKIGNLTRDVLVRTETLTLDEFFHFMPNGSNINSIWTMIKRAAEQEKLESGFDESKGFKWMVIGIVVMMVTIGTGVMVYLITGH